MRDRAILAFFAFFLVSRFFSEVLQILPKWVDIADLPVIVLLGAYALFFHCREEVDHYTHQLLVRLISVFILISLGSAFFNAQDALLPAIMLFVIGFISGPLLFVSLNRVVQNVNNFANELRRLFKFLLLANFFVVAFINIPRFLVTGNPDVIAGTYGINQNLFSVLLLICGFLLLGEDESLHRTKARTVLGQIFVLVTFYLLQFRAAIPFFLLAYILTLLALYGRRISGALMVAITVLLIAVNSTSIILARVQGEVAMKYEDWLTILDNPAAYLEYGKFQAYSQTIALFLDRPAAAIVGVGPGNYVSRAYYTFSYEMASNKSKGVGGLIEQFFGLSGPRFTRVSDKYIGSLRSDIVFGSYQLSNPHSSFLAPIAEVGLLGGAIIIGMYVFLVIKSFKLLQQAKQFAREFLPLATALVAGSVYLFGLAFLDNYWETSRATLPVWLLFWATSVGVQIRRTAQEAGEQPAVTAPSTLTQIQEAAS